MLAKWPPFCFSLFGLRKMALLAVNVTRNIIVSKRRFPQWGEIHQLPVDFPYKGLVMQYIDDFFIISLHILLKEQFGLHSTLVIIVYTVSCYILPCYN